MLHAYFRRGAEAMLRPQCIQLCGVAGRRTVLVAPSIVGVSTRCGETQRHLQQSPARLLHTSRGLLARKSFVKTITDKVNKLKNDPNIQNKIMGAGATGYAVTKVA